MEQKMSKDQADIEDLLKNGCEVIFLSYFIANVKIIFNFTTT